MPKKDDKRLATDPFERFLPQIGDSRKKKDDDISNDVRKDVDADVNKIKDNDKNKNNDVAVNISTDVDNVVNDDVNISTVINSADDVAVIDDVSEDVATNVVDDSAVSSDVAVSTGGTITISKKKFKSGDYARATYYLRPDQIRTINRLHKDSGRDKSELVRMAVDILIERARVE